MKEKATMQPLPSIPSDISDRSRQLSIFLRRALGRALREFGRRQEEKVGHAARAQFFKELLDRHVRANAPALAGDLRINLSWTATEAGDQRLTATLRTTDFEGREIAYQGGTTFEPLEKGN